MSWTPPPQAPRGYLLQYGNNGSFNPTLLLGANQSQYVVGGLMDKTNYTLRMLVYCDICIPSVWGVVSFVIAGECMCVRCEGVVMM